MHGHKQERAQGVTMNWRHLESFMTDDKNVTQNLKHIRIVKEVFQNLKVLRKLKI